MNTIFLIIWIFPILYLIVEAIIRKELMEVLRDKHCLIILIPGIGFLLFLVCIINYLKEKYDIRRIKR